MQPHRHNGVVTADAADMKKTGWTKLSSRSEIIGKMAAPLFGKAAPCSASRLSAHGGLSGARSARNIFRISRLRARNSAEFFQQAETGKAPSQQAAAFSFHVRSYGSKTTFS